MSDKGFTGNIPVKNYTFSCKVCGSEFNTSNQGETLCIVHRVLNDMKLPDDTIVGMNMINLWRAGRYDKEKGIQPILAKIAEGAILFKGKEWDDRSIYTRLTLFNSSLTSKNVERYVKSVIKHKSLEFDVVCVLRYPGKQNFYVFGLDYSKRMKKTLDGKSVLFKKKFAISLVTKFYTEKLVD